MSRAIHRLTMRCVSEANLIVSKGPLAPLTGMQNVTMRVAFATIVREAINVGRWYERTKRGGKEPPPLPRTRAKTVIVSPEALDLDNPGFDQDATTEPLPPRRR